MLIKLAALMLFLCPGLAMAAWILELPEHHVVRGGALTVADLAVGAVPQVAGEVVVVGRGKAGSLLEIKRSLVLRRLVEAGCAGGVVFRGASTVTVEFQGRILTSEDLRSEIRKKLQALVPVAQAGAPASWFEFDIPNLQWQTRGEYKIRVDRQNPLAAGRSQVRLEILSAGERRTIPVNVVLHVYGEIPAATRQVEKGTALTPELFHWEWLDLSELPDRLVTGRHLLAGSCAARSLAAGDRLRINDLKTIPVIKAGDQVELQIQRGGLLVSVRALARQDGCRGQTIPVKNQLNGRLINARVLEPGKVEWRR